MNWEHWGASLKTKEPHCLSSGCYTHHLGVLNNRHLLLLRLLESVRSGCQRDWVFGEISLPGLQMAVFSVSSPGREPELALWPLLIRVLIPFMRALPSGPNHLQRLHLQIPPHWGLRFQCMSFGGTQTFSP